MSEINVEARDRYYAEVSLKLNKAGFAPQPQEDGCLPIDWNGSCLCRLTANGGVQYREEHVERDGGGEALDRVIDIAGTTAEYMRCHVRNLREKLYAASPESPFTIHGTERQPHFSLCLADAEAPDRQGIADRGRGGNGSGRSPQKTPTDRLKSVAF